MVVEQKEGARGEIFSCCSFIPHFFILFHSVFQFSVASNAAVHESASDRDEMSTTECIEFLQSGELSENKGGTASGQKNFD